MSLFGEGETRQDVYVCVIVCLEVCVYCSETERARVGSLITGCMQHTLRCRPNMGQRQVRRFCSLCVLVRSLYVEYILRGPVHNVGEVVRSYLWVQFV